MIAPHLAALRRCWHPVAYEHAVTDRPHATTLLGEPLVLWRDSRHVAHAFRDVCIHRGAALSLGRVVESQRPERVPFDLAAELHLAFDALAVAYRRAMQAHAFAPSP